MIRRLSDYLTPEQIDAERTYSKLFMVWYRDRSDENKQAYEAAHEEFLKLTGGKEYCELVPAGVYKTHKKGCDDKC